MLVLFLFKKDETHKKTSLGLLDLCFCAVCPNGCKWQCFFLFFVPREQHLASGCLMSTKAFFPLKLPAPVLAGFDLSTGFLRALRGHAGAGDPGAVAGQLSLMLPKNDACAGAQSPSLDGVKGLNPRTRGGSFFRSYPRIGGVGN